MDAVREPPPAPQATDPTPNEPPPAPAAADPDSDAIDLARRLTAILRRREPAARERPDPTPFDGLQTLS